MFTCINFQLPGGKPRPKIVWIICSNFWKTKPNLFIMPPAISSLITEYNNTREKTFSLVSPSKWLSLSSRFLAASAHSSIFIVQCCDHTFSLPSRKTKKILCLSPFRASVFEAVTYNFCVKPSKYGCTGPMFGTGISTLKYIFCASTICLDWIVSAERQKSIGQHVLSEKFLLKILYFTQ
jgi:hypothetical protein